MADSGICESYCHDLWQTSCSLFSSPSLQVSGHVQFLTSLSGSSDSVAILVFWDACFKEHYTVICLALKLKQQIQVLKLYGLLEKQN